MANGHTVLVPIRYPLTAKSTQTLTSAERIAHDYNNAQLIIFHVNLFQYNENVKEAEIRQAVTPVLDDVPFSVSIRQGFLIEEVILEEAQQRNIDAIVIGEKQNPLWRRAINMLLRNDPDIAPFLKENTGTDIEVKTAN
ncbi:universal stress protein [Natrinema salinisoli]|uniref:universal stress protein n=1 Tax=Natrinema salinisoli TaxID=2878535 RepID=UPI001CF0516D|nr:universal stress protein [Natrinema salinisoli]